MSGELPISFPLHGAVPCPLSSLCRPPSELFRRYTAVGLTGPGSLHHGSVSHHAEATARRRLTETSGSELSETQAAAGIPALVSLSEDLSCMVQ